METKKINVAPEEAGKRLDVYLTEALPELSRSRIAKLTSEGLILVGERPVKAGYKLKTGDEISVTIPEEKPLSAEAQNIDIEIVYEDDQLAVVNKPRGMVVHPSHGHEDGTLVNALMYHFGDSLSGINGVLRPGIVHRIDKDTSGLLVICKTDEAHRHMAGLLETHDIERTYHAVLHGKFKEPKGTVDAPIGRMNDDRKKMTVRSDGRRAVTHYEVLEEFGSYSYVKLNLETGRTHQIRVHMKHIGHSVVGDPLYGPLHETTSKGKQLEACDFWPGQILHAKTLGFVHPTTGELMRFDSDLPDYFQTVLRILTS